MIGQGKYDSECQAMISHLDAEAVLLVVVNGDRGPGVSLAVDTQKVSRAAMDKLPQLMRDIGDALDKDIAMHKAQPTN